MSGVIVTVRSLVQLILALVLCRCAGTETSSVLSTVVEESQPKPAPMEAVFKNIQVLKGVPNTELLPIMNFMRSSLGVRCEYCHVAENGKYQLDEKAEKRRARAMMLMTRTLNQVNFGGVNVITCNTCHRGAVTPVAVPEISSTFVNTVRRDPDEPVLPPLPLVAELIARHEAATHVSALPPLHLTLEAWHAKVLDAGTPRARVVARGEYRAAVMGGPGVVDGERAVGRSILPDGRFIYVGSDGKRAWTSGPDGLRWIPSDSVAQFQRKLNPLIVVRARASDFTESRVSDVEMIGDRETYVVTARGTDGIVQKLWFAKGNGLLIRRTFYHPFALGLDPEQFDLSEYKKYGEFELPSLINTSYLDDQHLGVLKKIVDIQLNVPVSDSDFLPRRDDAASRR